MRDGTRINHYDQFSDMTLPSRSRGQPGSLVDGKETIAADDEHERRVRLLLLSKEAVLVYWFQRPLAAELDDR